MTFLPPPWTLQYLLPLLLAVPVAGALVATVVPKTSAKTWALGVSLATALLAIVAALITPDSGYVITPPNWLSFGTVLPTLGLRIDAISVCLVLLTAVLVPLAIASTFATTTVTNDRPRQFYAWMLALEAALLGAFVARDLLLFYACFELTLVPAFFLIGIWGGVDRREAAGKFFLYTFAASVFTLAAIVYVGGRAGSFDIQEVVRFAQRNMTAREQFWVAIGLLSAFVVKSAVFPLHTWLPMAYTEAPTSVTVLLAGVLPKLGTYGLLRVAIPIGLVSPVDLANGVAGPTRFPTLCIVIGFLAVVGILYGAMIAWVQKDMKRLLAYSSFSHLGFCVLGLMALDQIGAQGSLLYMVNHGLSTGALFLVAGMIFDRFATHDRTKLGGLAKGRPWLAFFLVLFAMSSIGLPGLNGFVSEFLCLLGTFGTASPNGPQHSVQPSQLGPVFGSLAAVGMVLAAVYMLGMVNGLLFGPVKVPAVRASSPKGTVPPGDLNRREIAILAPLAVLVVVLGVAPSLVLTPTFVPVEQTLRPRPAAEQPEAPILGPGGDVTRAAPAPSLPIAAVASR